jgi:hypothetical protein
MKAGRLVHYALMLQGLGPQRFDSETSRSQRYTFIADMRAAGIYWDEIRFTGTVERWWLGQVKRTRRTA